MKASAFALAALLATLLLVGTGGSASAKPQLRIGYVTYPGTVPNERDLFGVPLLAFMRAVKQFDVQGRVLYVPPFQDPAVQLESLARQKYDLVIVGLPNVTGIDAVAGKFPRVKFLLPDASVDSLPHRRRNVLGTVFRTEEAAFLAGYLAAMVERRQPGRHVVSSVGGMKNWGVDRWIVGFNAGAGRADPGGTRLTGYSQDFANPEKCQTIASSQIARGSGVLFNVAGGCGFGTLEAAKAHGVWGVGVDLDQSFLGPHILTSAVVKGERPIVDAIRRLVNGRLTTGGDRSFGLSDDGVGLGKISSSVPASIVRRVEEIRRRIVAGEIEVPVVRRS